MLSAKQSSRTSNFNVFCSTRPGIEPPTSRMPGETLNHYTTRTRYLQCWKEALIWPLSDYARIVQLSFGFRISAVVICFFLCVFRYRGKSRHILSPPGHAATRNTYLWGCNMAVSGGNHKRCKAKAALSPRETLPFSPSFARSRRNNSPNCQRSGLNCICERICHDTIVRRLSLHI